MADQRVNIVGFSVFNKTHPFFQEFVQSLNRSWQENCDHAPFAGTPVGNTLVLSQRMKHTKWFNFLQTFLMHYTHQVLPAVQFTQTHWAKLKKYELSRYLLLFHASLQKNVLFSYYHIIVKGCLPLNISTFLFFISASEKIQNTKMSQQSPESFILNPFEKLWHAVHFMLQKTWKQLESMSCCSRIFEYQQL